MIFYLRGDSIGMQLTEHVTNYICFNLTSQFIYQSFNLVLQDTIKLCLSSTYVDLFQKTLSVVQCYVHKTKTVLKI